jgi:hypothetical protein
MSDDDCTELVSACASRRDWVSSHTKPVQPSECPRSKHAGTFVDRLISQMEISPRSVLEVDASCMATLPPALSRLVPAVMAAVVGGGERDRAASRDLLGGGRDWQAAGVAGRQDTRPTLEDVCRTYLGVCFAVLLLLLLPALTVAPPADCEILPRENAKLLFLLAVFAVLFRIVLVLESSSRALEAMAGMLAKSQTFTVLSLLPVASSQA